MPKKEKKLTIVSGPNGSGKTTFVRNSFSELVHLKKFINADDFARELSPENTEEAAIKAGKKFLKEVHRLINSGETFILETTLSGKSLHKTIQRAKQKGFTVRLIFLWIDIVDLCDFRVKGRVASGGHNIPFESIVRRYKRGLLNLEQYLKKVDEYKVYLANEKPQLVYSKNEKSDLQVWNMGLFSKLESQISTLSSRV